MISNDHFVISSCEELTTGDAIEAFYKGTRLYRGPVMEIGPQHGLFWSSRSCVCLRPTGKFSSPRLGPSSGCARSVVRVSAASDPELNEHSSHVRPLVAGLGKSPRLGWRP